jgi:putative membrane protein
MAAGPSDPQIVVIVLAADQIDIDYGTIALAKSNDKTVRDFAQRMVTDHSAVQKNVIALAEKLHVRAEDSPTSEGLKKGAAGALLCPKFAVQQY